MSSSTGVELHHEPELIVVDTNVIVSALVFGGLPRQVLDLVARGACDMYYSPPIREEVERVLAKKFGWHRREIAARTGLLFSWATEVHPEEHLAAIKDDPDDDRVLECALAAQAQVIISGDKHLLNPDRSSRSWSVRRDNSSATGLGWNAAKSKETSHKLPTNTKSAARRAADSLKAKY